MSSNTARVFQNDAIEEIAKIISKITGNQFSVKHTSMIEFRLKKRCQELKLSNIEEYYSFFKIHQTTELKYLISLLTTHHTFFFREFSHFQFLEEKALPLIIPIVRLRKDKKIRVWSAACSKGHEVYSLAMFLNLNLKQMAPDISYEILGSDIDHESLEYAQNGVYSRKEINEVPLSYLDNHWVRGTGDISEYVKAKSSLRDQTRWMPLNLLTLPENFSTKFDLIFCRNVFIYFNGEQIKQSSLALLKHLEPHGYYFIGLSESLNNLDLPLISQGPSVYKPIQKSNLIITPEPAAIKNNPTKPLAPKINSNFTSPTEPPVKDILKVFCVDDSPSIIILLKKILTKEYGFEVVGTATNGIEAAAGVKNLKPDLMTLDIHMPIQSGIEYLKKNFNSVHPPVIIMSSVSREESELALTALHSGASDYVEKPALANLNEISEEIRRKLRSAYRSQVIFKQKTNLNLDDSFKKTIKIKNPENFLRIIITSLSNKQRVETLIHEFGSNQPPTFILLDGAKENLHKLAETYSFSKKIITAWPDSALKCNEIYFADAQQFNSLLTQKVKDIPTSILAIGELSPKLKTLADKWSKFQILIEDLGTNENKNHPFREIKTDIVPFTSFAYMSCEFFGRLG
jgi:chemotaxis protein methyltransferase CheR